MQSKDYQHLRNCPFCGSEDIEIYYDDFSDYWIVECRECGVERNRCWDEDDAIEVWNTRPIEDEKDKEIERLKKKLSNIKYILTQYRDVSLIKINAKEAESTHFFAFKFCNNLLEDINDTDINVGSMEVTEW